MLPPSSSPDRCQPFTLATSPIGSVTLCPDCGVVQLHMHGVSLRMDTTVLDALSLMLASARRHRQVLEALASPLQPSPSETSHAPVH